MSISHSFIVTQRYIQSCTRPRHLVVANNILNRFRTMYEGNRLLSEYMTRLCCDMQLKRIDIKLTIAELPLK